VSAPPYRLKRTATFDEVITEMQRKPGQNRVKLRKIAKTLELLREFGPSYPGLNAHKYESLPEVIPGQPVWEVYVENHTPGAWRLFYCHGPGPNELTIITVGPHP
jgi:hypothetical protein